MGKATRPASARQRKKMAVMDKEETAVLAGTVPPNTEKTSLELLYGKPGVPVSDPVKALNEAIEKNMQPIEGQHRVAVIKDHLLDFPELFMEVFVASHGDRYEEAAFASMLTRARCQRAKSVLEADLVIFVGGADVDPGLYGCTDPHKSVSFSAHRDKLDMDLYLLCLEQGIPMFGVCRGAQFLHVMNGGKLYNDVDQHYGDHAIFDQKHNRIIAKTSSVHHQMCIPFTEGGMEILATAPNRSQKRYLNATEVERGNSRGKDVEAFFYRETCCLGVQGHPEYSNYTQYTKYCLDLINEYVACNPDIGFDQSRSHPNRRMSSELIKQRARLKPTFVITGDEK